MTRSLASSIRRSAWSSAGRLTLTDMALGGWDAAVALLCPCGRLGPLRVLPYSHVSV